MNANTTPFDVADAAARIGAATEFRSRAALTALSAAAFVLPAGGRFYVGMVASGTGLKTAVLALAAVAAAGLVAPAIPALRDHARQFDVAAGLVSIVLAFKLLQILAAAAQLGTIGALGLGSFAAVAAVVLGAMRGLSALRTLRRR